MKTYEVLEKALALIEDEKNWCGHGWGSGGTTGRCGLHAVASAEGEVTPAYVTTTPAGEALSDCAGQWFGAFNDTHSHAEVVALFQRAIRIEKQKEGIPLAVPEPVPA